MNKVAIRKSYLKYRKELSSEKHLELESMIFENFKLLDFSNINYLHIFLPILNQKEFNTFRLIDFIKTNFRTIKIVIPKVDFLTNEMISFVFERETILQENELGIMEPINGDIINPQLIDMVIVPLIAFDDSGNRIGYGKGFYDQFLVDCKPTVQRVGISFFEAVDKEIQIDEHDIKLSACVSPTRIYTFK